MTSTYEIRYSDNVPMAVEVDEAGSVVAAAAVYEESLLSMGLDTVDQLDIEDYLEQDYPGAEFTARALFS